MKNHYSFEECTGIKIPKRSRRLVGVFGYGSLVAKNEMELRDVEGRPKPTYALLNGFKRDWTACAGDGVCFLGITPDGVTTINGVVFWVEEWELGRLDMREALYDRVRVDGDVITYDSAEEIKGDIFTYVPHEQARANLVAGLMANPKDVWRRPRIWRRYYNIVEQAFRDGGKPFHDLYRKTTIFNPAIKISQS